MEAEADADRRARALIGKRIRANRALIAFAVLLVLLPMLERLGLPLLPNLWSSGKAIVLAWLSAVRLSVDPLWALYREIWPWAAVLLVVMAGLWWRGGDLQGRIKDQALRVWRFDP